MIHYQAKKCFGEDQFPIFIGDDKFDYRFNLASLDSNFLSFVFAGDNGYDPIFGQYYYQAGDNLQRISWMFLYQSKSADYNLNTVQAISSISSEGYFFARTFFNSPLTQETGHIFLKINKFNGAIKKTSQIKAQSDEISLFQSMTLDTEQNILTTAFDAESNIQYFMKIDKDLNQSIWLICLAICTSIPWLTLLTIIYSKVAYNQLVQVIRLAYMPKIQQKMEMQLADIFIKDQLVDYPMSLDASQQQTEYFTKPIYGGTHTLIVMIIESADLFPSTQSIGVNWYKSKINLSTNFNLYYKQVLKQLDNSHLIIGQAYVDQSKKPTYGVIFRSSPQAGCVAYNDLTKISQFDASSVQMHRITSSGEVLNNNDAQCWHDKIYKSTSEISIKLTDIRHLQKMPLPDSSNCDNMIGRPTIDYSKEKNDPYRGGLCMIGYPCKIEIGKQTESILYSIVQCSDVTSLKFTMSDQAQDLQQFTKKITIFLDEDISFLFNLYQTSDFVSGKIQLGYHLITLRVELNFQGNQFLYTY
ncbi:UNKNOWN [Stylonychia lemnae]|uniref:Uncharacterized protein n=1 Tax=Stylonychia lemnae TaxID=5949 RepID=A0A078AAD5_STYLE|nr:UNKNOWN [Stylonychia lemnae]|eukprot:CDW78557.1 UNKNOWN [Stylonychia lemnae]